VTDAPCEVWFYHLERASADEVLPELLRRTLERGWRARVKSPDAARLQALDARLWTAGRPESLLPHGLDSEPHAERQPILLTQVDANPNGAQALFLIDGAEAGPLDGLARCLDLFDGRDEAQVAAARDRWRSARAQGAKVSYWRQKEDGRWDKQA
jgi:DNA polymerase III subunit chi